VFSFGIHRSKTREIMESLGKEGEITGIGQYCEYADSLRLLAPSLPPFLLCIFDFMMDHLKALIPLMKMIYWNIWNTRFSISFSGPCIALANHRVTFAGKP
jgi:hypothetical protein